MQQMWMLPDILLLSVFHSEGKKKNTYFFLDVNKIK